MFRLATRRVFASTSFNATRLAAPSSRGFTSFSEKESANEKEWVNKENARLLKKMVNELREKHESDDYLHQTLNEVLSKHDPLVRSKQLEDDLIAWKQAW